MVFFIGSSLQARHRVIRYLDACLGHGSKSRTATLFGRTFEVSCTVHDDAGRSDGPLVDLTVDLTEPARRRSFSALANY